eukprot:scaffold7207_cov520-Prasinococcus_capsulatus_cf.AAC.17
MPSPLEGGRERATAARGWIGGGTTAQRRANGGRARRAAVVGRGEQRQRGGRVEEPPPRVACRRTRTRVRTTPTTTVCAGERAPDSFRPTRGCAGCCTRQELGTTCSSQSAA